jgi:L-ascorbate metabolism protein UlaG (beta-lactamase superfamily)
LTERVIKPGQLTCVEVVTSSHHHTDHLDPETLRPLGRVNPGLVLVCPEASRSVARERSDLPDARILGIDAAPGQPTSVTIGPFEFHAVPAAHESLERDARGRLVYLGYVIRFGTWSVYHSGDTVRFPGMEELLRPFRVDLALLPINGRGPERRVAGNLWGREAAALARDIGARLVIPCHYEMFAFNTASPDEFVGVCRELGQAHNVLRAGQRWTSAALRA